MDKNTLKSKLVAVDFALGDPGEENFRFMTQGGYGLGGFTEDFGAITDYWDKDPLTGDFVRLTPGREAPERIELPVTTKERVGVFIRDTLRLKKCPFVVRQRDYCGKPSDMLEYELLQYFIQSYATNLERSDPQATLDATEQERTLTMNVSASHYEVIKKVAARLVAINLTGYNDVDINDVWFCDAPGCGSCGCGAAASDGCQTLFMVTDADASPYATPYLIFSEDGGETLEARVITGATGNAIAGTCMGNKVVVVLSNNRLAYATKDGDYNDWTIVTGFADNLTNLWAVDAATAFATATGGAVYKTEDGAQTWTRILNPGVMAVTDLISIAFVDATLGYLGGNGGELLLYEDGTFSQLTPAVSGENINVIALVPDQPCWVTIGTSGGNIWKSKDQGATWTRVRFPGDGVGSVDDIVFAGAYGVAMYVIQTNADGDSRILRCLAGNAGGPDTEVVQTYTQLANNGYNAIAACNPNVAWLAGQVGGSGSSVLVKVQ